MYVLNEKESFLTKCIADAAYKVHQQLGPGLLEKIYEVCFCYELKKTALNLGDRLIFQFIMITLFLMKDFELMCWLRIRSFVNLRL